MGARAVTPEATRRRIRGFSVASWVVGVPVVLVAVFFALQAQAIERSYATFSPWERPVAVAAQYDEQTDRWSSDISAYIERGEDGPVEVVLTSQSGATLYVLPDEQPSDRHLMSVRLAWLSSTEPRATVLWGGDRKLWVAAYRPWSLRVQPIDATRVGEHFEASGDLLIWYRGPANQAIVEQIGTGSLEIEVISATAEAQHFQAVDNSKLPISWSGDEGVLVRVHSSEDTATWQFRAAGGAEKASQSTAQSTPEVHE